MGADTCRVALGRRSRFFDFLCRVLTHSQRPCVDLKTIAIVFTMQRFRTRTKERSMKHTTRTRLGNGLENLEDRRLMTGAVSDVVDLTATMMLEQPAISEQRVEAVETQHTRIVRPGTPPQVPIPLPLPIPVPEDSLCQEFPEMCSLPPRAPSIGARLSR